MRFLNKDIAGPFTIPSGIITASVSTIKLFFGCPGLGIITTKSIGLEPREGYREPILHQYAPGCFVNAVGLTNPGAKGFAEDLKALRIPKDRFLLVSIFGKDAQEFASVAKILAPYADGLELNLSCPHAKGYGMAIGQDPNAVKEIVSAVKTAVRVPVIPKLTPNVPDIRSIALAAKEGGADAISAINTAGPGYLSIEGFPVLSNKFGGLSGMGIFPLGLKCVKEIYESTGLPVIGSGGISDASRAREYFKAGANVCGIGSALAGMSTGEIFSYFNALKGDISKGTDNSRGLLKVLDMSYRGYMVRKNERLGTDLHLMTLDGRISINPGQFIFLWLPGIGEKPFSVLDDDPLTFAIQERGCFSRALGSLKEGEKVYLRGPYGKPVEIGQGEKPVLVAGGCGHAALYQISKVFGAYKVFLGSRDKEHLFYLDKAKSLSDVVVTTDDGSVGKKGFVTEALEDWLKKNKEKDLVFFNCGPEKMISACARIELRYSEKVFSAIDYTIRCGVGLCGSCSDRGGSRICVDGPFLGEK